MRCGKPFLAGIERLPDSSVETTDFSRSERMSNDEEPYLGIDWRLRSSAQQSRHVYGCNDSAMCSPVIFFFLAPL
jgi:hypothetical protein